MRCRRCGKELENSMRCEFCGYENTEGNVREMTRTEKRFFNGVTIDADANDSRSSNENFGDYEFKTRRTYVNVGGGSNIFSRAIISFVRAVLNGNRLAQVAAMLIFAAFTGLMFFVALPILFVLLAIGLAFLALAKILR